MPWIPLHESGIAFTFNSDEGLDTLANSTVTSVGTGLKYTGWQIGIDPGQEVEFRLTPLAWDFPGAALIAHGISWGAAPDGTPTSTPNAAVNKEIEFSPAPVVATVGSAAPGADIGFYVNNYAPGLNVQWGIEVFTPCFWQPPVGASQVCTAEEGGGAPVIAFGSRIVGSGGGFIMQKSDWTGGLPNLISDALDIATNATVTESWNGTSWSAVSPPVPLYYQATGYGADPMDPGDTRCLACFEGDWNAAGLPSLTATTVRIQFGAVGTAEGVVESGIGS